MPPRPATTSFPVYLGPILLFAFGWRFLVRIVRLAKSQNITSVADFLAARYGKSQAVAAIVTVIAVAGTLPYIALQLKAVAISVDALLGSRSLQHLNLPTDTAFIIALTMATFAVLFGTRHIDATEHQEGLIVAVAAESLVKLAAFLTVGFFVVFSVFGGFGGLISRMPENPEMQRMFAQGLDAGNWITVTFLSLVCIVLLPRQFHVTVVENNSETEIRRAAWLFPLYLVLINIFVVPIAVAGLLTLPKGSFDADMFVLALPLSAGAEVVTLLAFVGGLSAATAMVIVDSVALAIMVSNGLVLPCCCGSATTSPRARRRIWRGSCSPSAAPRSLPSSCSAICSTGCWATPMAWPPSGSCRSPPSPSSRRRFSVAWCGAAPPRAGPLPASSPALPCGPTRCSCPGSWRRAG